MKRFFSSATALSFFLLSALGPAPSAWANPSFSHTEAGDIRIEEAGAIYNIYSADKSIGAFNSFGNLAGETINSIQASADHTALFRVIGTEPSVFFGALNANSRIFLVNPNGILFGPGSRINAPGLVASGLNIQNQDYLAGRYEFEGSSGGYVLNQGDIRVADGGFIALIGKAVGNDGNIVANGGSAALAAGDRVALAIDGTGVISVAIDAPVDAPIYDLDGNRVNDAIANAGVIEATGGKVILSAKAAEEIFDTVVNHSGTIRARSVANRGGVIELSGGESGVVSVSGTLDASGAETNTTGGFVTVLGEKIGLFENAVIDVSGVSGGGTALIGGDYKGQNPDYMNAEAVYLGEEVRIDADALASGDGGKVILWSDYSTKAYGTITARGGALSGDGGFIETSSHNVLDVAGIAVDASSANGEAGLWLLDPYNVTISGASSAGGSFAGTNPSVWTPSATSVISNATINTTLSSGTSVTINTTGAGGDDGDITVSAAISKTGGGDANLILNATNGIFINAPISSTTNKLNVELNGGSAASSDIVISSAITTNGGDFTAITTNGAITLAEVDQIINTVCATCANGDVTLESTTGINVLDDHGDGNFVEIKGAGTLTIEATSVGSGSTQSLGMDSVSELYITDLNGAASSMFFEEMNQSTINVIDITVPNNTSGDIDVDMFGSDVVDINNAHALNNINLTGSNASFSYLAASGDISITSVTTDTQGGGDTDIEATTGSIFFGAGNPLNLSSGYLRLTAGTAIQGNASTGTGNEEITITGAGMELEADRAGTTNILEIKFTNTTANETLDLTMTGSTGGDDFNLQIYNDIFNEISISQANAVSNVDVAMPGGDVIEINGGAAVVLNSVVLTNNEDPSFSYELTSGNVEIDSISADSTVSIETLSGSINEESPADAGSDITAPTVVLASTSGIGNAGTLEVNTDSLEADVSASGDIDIHNVAGTVTVSSATTGNGAVTLKATAGDLIVDDLEVLAGANNTTLQTAVSGNILIDSLVTTGAVAITSVGAIEEHNSDAAADITGVGLTLSAGTGIGAAGQIEINDTSALSATVTGTGAISLHDKVGGLTVTSATAADGDITFQATGGNLDVTTATAGGTNRNISLSTVTSGDVSLDDITALADLITITSAGVIKERSSGDGAADLSAQTASLQSASGIFGINSSDPLEFNLTQVSLASVSGTGSIYLSDLTGGLIIGSAATNNGFIAISTAGALNIQSVQADTGVAGSSSVTLVGGGPTVVGIVRSDASVSITTSSGNIVDANDTALNVTAGGTALFDTAVGFDVGTASDFIEVTAASVDTSGVDVGDETFICSGTGCDPVENNETNGLILDGNKIAGGDQINEFTSSTSTLYEGEETSSDESEEEEEKDSTEATTSEAVTDTQPTVEQSEALSPETKVDAQTFAPCSV